MLPHVEGTWDTKHIKLEPAQVFFLVQLFGFRNQHGGRRFTEALFCVARKNAKSTLAAAILLATFCLESEQGAQAISAATTGSQARIVWKIAKEMATRCESLRDAFDVECFANFVERNETGGTLKPINSKASTQDGLNPSHTNFDEVHAHKNSDLINVLRSAAGARANPLWLYTTTEGYESPGPWPDLRHFAHQVLERVVAADHFLAVIFALDEEDDEFDEAKWIKANPLYDVNHILREQIAQLAINAKNMPSAHGEFRIKRCNLPSASARGWVNLAKWNRCAGAVDLDALVGVPCWGALDLASTSDLASWRLLWLLGDQFYTWGRSWVPEAAVKQRTESNRTAYGGWIQQGYITQTGGDVIDYDVIRAEVISDCVRFAPSKIGYDSWNAAGLVNDFVAEELPMEMFVQGFKSYNPAMKECERVYQSGRLHHGGNPVLRWCMSNVVPAYDANMNVKPDRKRSAEKIDDAVTLFMCFGLSAAATEEGDPDGFFAAPVRSGVSATR